MQSSNKKPISDKEFEEVKKRLEKAGLLVDLSKPKQTQKEKYLNPKNLDRYEYKHRG